jgi:hypothetical protein
MKKMLSLLGVMLVVVIAASIVMIPSRGVSLRGSNPETYPKMPDSISKIVEKACVSCHSGGGNPMAASHWSYSKWDTYKVEKQADKAKAICKELSAGKMPPKGFRESRPKDVPSEMEVKMVCNWSNALMAAMPKKK